MQGTDIAILAVVVALVCIGVRRIVGTATGTRDCCSGDKKQPNHVKVSDKNPHHYPYQQTYRVQGMTCKNCAKYVTDALNSIKDT